jgi:hypothetical protein
MLQKEINLGDERDWTVNYWWRGGEQCIWRMVRENSDHNSKIREREILE